MTKLRFGVKKPFGSNIPSEPYKPKPKPDASDILFETINHLEETGAIKINDEEILQESIVSLLRTGVITVNISKSVSLGRKITQDAKNLARIGEKFRRDKDLEDMQKSISDALKSFSDIAIGLQDLIRRNSYISGAGGLFIDRTYKLLRKMDRKRR